MDLRERIKAARNNLGITQDELAKYSGISIQNIKKLETKENTNPTNNTLQKLAIALKVDSDYFVSQLSPNIVSQLSPNQEKPVPQSKNFPQTLNDDIVSIPFYEDIRASAGSGAYNEAETAEQLNFPKSFLRQYFGIISFNNLSIIVGKGDSMSPTLPESCYLLVQNGSVNDGEICIARLDDELYVKRLQKRPRLKLISDNKAYDPIELDGANFEIIGRVVGYFKKTSL